MLFPIVLKMTPAELFPQLFLADHATVKLENSTDIKVRLSVQYTKINSEWFIDLGVKSKTMKQSEKKNRGKPWQPWIRQLFLEYDTKSTIHKEKN